jgi:ribonucleoside-diphosphate reductase alpha chain
LKGISGPNPTWEDGRLILSTPDAIGKALDDYLHEEQNQKNGTQDDRSDQKLLITLAPTKDETDGKNQESFITGGIILCEKCNNYTVFNEGGCLNCHQCGWSKCD